MVFLRIQRKSTKEDACKGLRSNGRLVVYRTLAKTSDEWLSRVHSILLKIDRLQLTAVSCNRRVCKDNTSKDPFSQCEQLQGIHIQVENEYVCAEQQAQ